MKKIILMRTGEIFLKGKNIAFFENTLINNIKSHLAGIEYKFVRSQNRFYIEKISEIAFFFVILHRKTEEGL